MGEDEVTISVSIGADILTIRINAYGYPNFPIQELYSALDGLTGIERESNSDVWEAVL